MVLNICLIITCKGFYNDDFDQNHDKKTSIFFKISARILWDKNHVKIARRTWRGKLFVYLCSILPYNAERFLRCWITRDQFFLIQAVLDNLGRLITLCWNNILSSKTPFRSLFCSAVRQVYLEDVWVFFRYGSYIHIIRNVSFYVICHIVKEVVSIAFQPVITIIIKK